METIIVRLAKREDCDSIVRLRQELEAYNATQSHSDKVDECIPVSAEGLAQDGFDRDTPYFKCLLAELCDSGSDNPLVVGYAMYYYTYEAFHGRAIYLENMFISENYRSHGVGSAIFKSLGKRTKRGGISANKFEISPINANCRWFFI